MKYLGDFSKEQLISIALSFIIMAVSVIVTCVVTQLSLFWTIMFIILTQISSCFFFPIIVGQIIDKEKAKRDFGVINSFYQDFSEGGIIQVYKDREASDRSDNGEAALKRAFEEHDSGEVKLIGVTLRVFFNQTGPFYSNIEKLCAKSMTAPSIELKALINSENAPETLSRGKIESPNIDPPTIKIEMRATKQHIFRLNEKTRKEVIHVKEYDQAPYCTAIIFPNKCFFSQNLLCDTAPVRLPLVVMNRESHGYTVVNSYFDYLWNFEEVQ